jgi:hypothetical protein
MTSYSVGRRDPRHRLTVHRDDSVEAAWRVIERILGSATLADIGELGT